MLGTEGRSPHANWVQWWFWTTVKRLRRGKGKYPIWTGLSHSTRLFYTSPEGRSVKEYYAWINDEQGE